MTHGESEALGSAHQVNADVKMEIHAFLELLLQQLVHLIKHMQ